MRVGRVSVLARYPVKSMQGEVLSAVEVSDRGLRADREWALYTADGGIGSGKTTRRFRRVDGLLRYRATSASHAGPTITFPSGDVHRAGEPATDAALGAALGRSVQLRPEADVPHHDESPVHLVTTGTLRHLGALLGRPIDARRLRANVVLCTDEEFDGFVEDGWTGRDLALGDTAVLRLGLPMTRCVMVDLPPDGGDTPPRLLTRLAQIHEMTLGLQADVLHPGTVRYGDLAELR